MVPKTLLIICMKGPGSDKICRQIELIRKDSTKLKLEVINPRIISQGDWYLKPLPPLCEGCLHGDFIMEEKEFISLKLKEKK